MDVFLFLHIHLAGDDQVGSEDFPRQHGADCHVKQTWQQTHGWELS